MALKITNNPTSKLAGSLSETATSLSVEAGTGAKFPSLSEGDWFPLVVVNGSGDYEIMRCTARSGDLMTVTRAQEGTSAAAFDAGSRIDLRLTAGAIAEFVNAGDALLKTSNLSDLSNKATARSNLGLGSAAEAETTDFATAAQGEKADNALTTDDLADVAVSGSYNDLSDKPTTIAHATTADSATTATTATTATNATHATSADSATTATTAGSVTSFPGYHEVGSYTVIQGNSSSPVFGGQLVTVGDTVPTAAMGGIGGTWLCMALFSADVQYALVKRTA